MQAQNEPMKPSILLPALLLWSACADPAPHATLELVESVPSETTLGSEDLRATHAVWMEAFDGASERLDLAFFYTSDVAPSRLTPLIAAVERAAERGVRVRLLTDAGFYKTYPEIPDRLGAHAGIDVRLYDMKETTGGGVLHAKYMVIDADLAFLGSPNFDYRSLEHIQELGVLMKSAPLAQALRAVFDLDWAIAAGEPRPAARATSTAQLHLAEGEALSVRPVFSPPTLLPDPETADLPWLLEWIGSAESTLRVQLLSYSRYAVLDDALRAAAARGVVVELLVADWNKRPRSLAALKELQSLPGIEVRFVTIPESSAGFVPYARVIHAKYMLVDGVRSWIGTSNWSRGYFEDSRNVGLLVEGRSFAERLERFFQRGWDSEYAETLDVDREYEVPRIGE